MTFAVSKTRLLKSALAGCAMACVMTLPAQALDTVKIGWPAAFASNMAHLTFGKEIGVFKDENLDWEVVSMQGTFPVVQQILSGGFDTGYVGVETVVQSAQPNAVATPLRFVYNYTRQSIWEMVVLEDSPIKDLAELKGKTIGIAGPTFGNVPGTKAAMEISGVKPNEYTFLSTGAGAPAFRALTTKQADALNLWDTMHATMEAMGTKVRRLSYPEGIDKLSSHGFAFTEDSIKNRPEFIARFGRAIAKSIIACDANLEECIRSFWRAFPAQKPQGTDEAAMKQEKIILGARLKKLLYFPEGAPKVMGSFSDQEWKSIINSLKLGGVITKTDIPMDQLYTSKFFEDFNKFDAAEIRKRAEAATKK